MECDFNLLCHGLFKIPKILIIFKILFKHLKIIIKKNFFCDFFYMSYSIMT
jgi:hypothetical protein